MRLAADMGRRRFLKRPGEWAFSSSYSSIPVAFISIFWEAAAAKEYNSENEGEKEKDFLFFETWRN
jgi:hypothetical protein